MILVAGATGALGGRIVRRLLEEEHPVRAFARPGPGADALRAAGIEVAQGDLRRPDTIAAAMRGVAAVVSTANSASRSSPDTVESVDLAGNAALIEAAREERVEHFVFISAHGADESSPIPFLRAKAVTERRLRESGSPFTVLRPNLFMESWLGSFVVAPIRAGRTVSIVGGGSRLHTFVALDDVARFATAVIGNPPALARTIPFGGPEALSWLDVIELAAELVGRVIPVRHLSPGTPIPGMPDAVAQLAAGLDRFDSILDGATVAREFGVELTPVRQWLEARLVDSA
jgi:uncharacterized protein YbjT (DUF2867 family)